MSMNLPIKAEIRFSLMLLFHCIQESARYLLIREKKASRTERLRTFCTVAKSNESDVFLVRLSGQQFSILSEPYIVYGENMNVYIFNRETSCLLFLPKESVNSFPLSQLGTVQNNGSVSFVEITPDKKPILIDIFNGVDLGKQSFGLIPVDFRPKALFLDFDSTILRGETLDLLAKSLGLAEDCQHLTRCAMAGRVSFKSALKDRLKMIKGLSLESINSKITRFRIHEGVNSLCSWAQELSISVHILSGGFKEVIEKVVEANALPITSIVANQLDFDCKGNLLGSLSKPLIDGQAKARWLNNICHREKITKDQAVAIGDGANDLEMMKLAGVSVGYSPKEILQDQVNIENYTLSHNFHLDILTAMTLS